MRARCQSVAERRLARDCPRLISAAPAGTTGPPRCPTALTHIFEEDHAYSRDVHQPLHSTMLFSRGLFPHGDRGGNNVITVEKGNLHSLWDDFPAGKLKFSTIRNRAVTFMANPALANLGQQAATDLDEETWLKES